MTARSIDPSAFITKAIDIASFYGFRPVRALETKIAASERPRMKAARSFEEVASVCVSCMALEKRGPLLCFSIHATPEEEGYSPREFGEFGLQLVGSTSSLGDVFILKTLITILGESGIKVEGVRLNSVGDRESQGRYGKELGLYIRKRADGLTPACRAAASENPLALFSCAEEPCKQAAVEAPRAITYLSEASRTHFKGVLERLERLDIPYYLDDSLTGDARASRVLFSLNIAQHPLIAAARGGRYDEYLRRVTGRKEGIGVRGTILFRKKGLERREPEATRARPPRLYFVQLGPEAKFKGLEVLEVLRRARIPIYQSFESDKLAPQLEEATSLNVPYLLIMGHKEALEQNVIVRNVSNRMQNIVRVTELPVFLRRELA